MDPDGVGPSSLWNTSIGLIVPAIGILVALALPGLASNFGRHLSEDEGLGVPARRRLPERGQARLRA